MTDVVLFHHVHGLTDGIRQFADRLRAAGHRVTLPDLFDGKVFANLDDGMAYAQSVGFDVLSDRGVAAVADLPERVVYGGFSLGLVAAQRLAQTRPAALGALLYHGGFPADEFADSWPAGVALQAHVNEHDELGDVDYVKELVAGVPGAELFLYPGDTHLFTDASLSTYDAEATELVIGRTLELLARVG